MKNYSQQSDVVMEMLKLVFFIVAYMLTASEYNMIAVGDNPEVHTSFYNTLFIFSATTWIDYLSRFHIFDTDRFINNTNVLKPYNIHMYIILGIYGLFAVFTMMYIVCCKDDACLFLAMLIYVLSAIYVSVKAYIVTDLLLDRLTR